MLLLAFIIIVPAYLAFRRGHNGYLITLLTLLSYALGLILGALTASNLVFICIFMLGWLIATMYCALSIGPLGNQLAIKTPLSNDVDSTDMPAEVEVQQTDYVTLKAYAESWRQGELSNDAQALRDANIHYRATSGLLAIISVRQCDYDAAAVLLGIDHARG